MDGQQPLNRLELNDQRSFNQNVPGESSPIFAVETQDSLEGAFSAAARAHEALANPGAQVDQVAKQIAPSLDTEVRARAADQVDPNPEVTHELLETYKEQKKILADQRDTIDSVLKEVTK